ncbi:MAG: type I DNA topoisomerase [bacterium]
MAKTNLVIVESPTKAKTISKFLGSGYAVASSFGHVRDLPERKMGVDTANHYEPSYVIPPKAKEHVKELQSLAKKAEDVYLATDEDREGEAIAWHLQEVLGIKEAKRITFHEITKTAIEHALTHPRQIDDNLVDAQQARRVLDRLVGYELSPFLWKKVYRGLSAGRVQSVTVRLVVEREREIKEFKPEEYWTIEADFGDKETLKAKLTAYQEKTLEKFSIKAKDQAEQIVNTLQPLSYNVASIESKETKRSPYPPFTTSTLQQEANRRLGMSVKQTMMHAQHLYERGHITYMRTDSVNLADKFLVEAQGFITKEYGKNYHAGWRKYVSKNKLAQEAHEAIRPTDVTKHGSDLMDTEPAARKLYDLIWQRAMACQMADAEFISKSIVINDGKETGVFKATGSTVKFQGWLAVYPDSRDDVLLPDVKEGQSLPLQTITPLQHFTEPPARYSEAGLVKVLEELGIGRPSTYAPTISTIIERGYVEKRLEDKRLQPTEVGMLVNDLLVENFPEIVDYGFTAKLEDDLDEIAEGKKEWVPVIDGFYKPFKKNLTAKYETVDKKQLTEETTDEKCPKCGSPMVLKLGRFGKFLACTNYPECKTTKPYGKEAVAQAEALKDAPACDKCGKPMVVKRGRFGIFLGCSGYPECKNIKKVEKGTGVKCPKCEKGELVQRRSKKGGRLFYSCNRYPDCEFALWSKPTGEKCSLCQSLMVYGKNDTTVCSNKECKNNS